MRGLSPGRGESPGDGSDEGPESEPPAGAPDGLPPGRRGWAMLTVILGIGLSVLDSSMLMLALPEIVRDLGIGARDAVTVVYAYQIAVLALLLPLSLAGDLFGYRRVYLVGATLFALAATASFLSHGLVQLAAARALQGMAAAGLMAVNAALVRLIYPRRALGTGIAINSAVVAGSAVAGPALASALLALAGWHWLFVPGIAAAALVTLLGWRSLPDNHAPAPAGARLPWPDIALNGATFVLVFVGAQGLAPHGGTAAAGSRWFAAAMLAAGLALGVFYVRRQRRLRLPLLPVDLLAIPVFRLSMLTSVAAFAAQTLAAIALPFLLLERLRRSPAEAGWILAAWPLSTVGVAPLTARLIGRVPGGLLGGIGLALLAAGLVALAVAPWVAAPAGFAASLALCGLGWGLFQSPNNHTIVTTAPLHRAGGAAGMLSTARLTGQATGAVVTGLLYGLAGASSASVPAAALGVAAACALAAGATSLLRLRV